MYALLGYKPAWNLGGPIHTAAAVAERLVARGHQVTVIASNSNLTEDLDCPTDRPINVAGVEVWYFRRQEPIRRLFPFIPYLSKSVGFLYCPRLKRALEEIIPAADVVDVQAPFVYPTLVTGRAALCHRKPLFYHQHGSLLRTHLGFRRWKKEAYIRLFERPLMKGATSLIGLTEAERDAFREWVDTRCVIVPNGVDAPVTLDRAAAGEDVRAGFGISTKATVVLFLGRLHPWKGADRLIDAFLKVRPRHPEAVLVVAGPDEWGLEASLRNRLAGGDEGRTVVFPGVVAGRTKAALLARADLFCLPSMGEGFSMAVLEAMAHGTPVMLSPECGFPSVDQVGAGVTVARDVASIADGLDRLLGDPEGLRRMGIAARREVVEHYSWDRITEQLIEVYQDGIDRVRGGPARGPSGGSPDAEGRRS